MTPLYDDQRSRLYQISGVLQYGRRTVRQHSQSNNAVFLLRIIDNLNIRLSHLASLTPPDCNRFYCPQGAFRSREELRPKQQTNRVL